MLLLFLAVFIMEDSIVPSLRLSALGTDFQLLAEDPLADVQFNPAQLGSHVSPSIHFKPEWTLYWPEGAKVSAAALYPKIYHHVCLGVLGSCSYSKKHYYYKGDNDTTIDLETYPSASFIAAFPFLKNKGFFGLSGTIKAPNQESMWRSHDVFYDTMYYNADTSYYSDTSYRFHQDVNKTTVWSLRGGQYLPFENSAVSIVFAVTRSKPEVSYYDSSYHEGTDMNINHYDSTRTMHYSHGINEDYHISTENNDIWQYDLGIIWGKDIDKGHMRFLCRGGLGHGDITQHEILKQWYSSEYRYEYTSPDTTYSSVDTNIYTDVDEDIAGTGDITRDNEEIGFGLEKSVRHDVSLLIGLRLGRSHNNTKETVPDTATMTETTYKAIMPLGAEVSITRNIVIRGGITLSYTNLSKEETRIETTQFTDSYLSASHSFGLGITLMPHFSLDMFNEGYNLTNIDSWRFEGIYRF